MGGITVAANQKISNEPGKKKGQLPAGLNGGVCRSRADSAAESGVMQNSIETGLVLRATRPIDFPMCTPGTCKTNLYH